MSKQKEIDAAWHQHNTRKTWLESLPTDRYIDLYEAYGCCPHEHFFNIDTSINYYNIGE